MATAITVPDIGTTVDRVKLVKWLKEEGDTVRRGDPLCEVETDKAVSELESIAEGVLIKRVVAEDTDVDQGAVLAYVGVAGEPVPESPPATASAGRVDDAPAGGRAQTPAAGRSVSPLIRKLADREGVDLERVTGTGPGGTITRDDVMAAKASAAAEAPTGLAPGQRAIARALAESQREVLPFNLVCRIDMSAASRQLDRLESELGWRAPLDAVFIFAASRFIKEFPNFMSHMKGETVARLERVGVSFAAALRDGLQVLVVKDADTKSLAEIQQEVKRMFFSLARGKATATAATTPACFGISNLSKYPVHSFNALIPRGQSSILALGEIEETPVVRDGDVTAVPFCHVTLTVDHRLINGSEAGQFLARLKQAMETL